MEPTAKKWKRLKLNSKKMDMLRSIGKQYRESMESVLKKRKATVEGLAERKSFKPGMKQ